MNENGSTPQSLPAPEVKITRQLSGHVISKMTHLATLSGGAHKGLNAVSERIRTMYTRMQELDYEKAELSPGGNRYEQTVGVVGTGHFEDLVAVIDTQQKAIAEQLSTLKEREAALQVKWQEAIRLKANCLEAISRSSPNAMVFSNLANDLDWR